ncbi:hypothetical protein D3C84_908190 [compost metagenome]
MQAVAGELTQVGLAVDLFQGGAGNHRQRVGAEVGDGLGPDRIADALAGAGFDSRSRHHRPQLFQARCEAVVGLAEDHQVRVLRLGHGGGRALRGDEDHAADHPGEVDAFGGQALRVHGADVLAGEAAFQAVEVPPGQAVDHRHHQAIGV